MEKTIEEKKYSSENKISDYDLYIISFTHWDREWYYSFEKFRQILIEIVDNVLNTLENDKRFKAFHFDGQTAQILDYLEIKPYNKKRILKLAKEGRLLIGPHYIQSDEHIPSGESQIRNVLLGIRDCESLKIKPMKAAFLLDQFGHCSQTPQILKGFDIDSILIARGVLHGVNGKNTFYWIAPDGSKCLTNFLPQWYNNFQRAPQNVNDAKTLLNNIIEGQKNKLIGKSIVLMNGVDHLDIQSELPDNLEKIKSAELPYNLIHTSAEEFFNSLKKEVKQYKSLPTKTGELREGEDDGLLSGTLSSRLYLKQQNAMLSRNIEKVLEPISSLADLLKQGFYPSDSINYLWRTFIQNHPHDSICGCSIDETHFQMVSRNHRVNDILEYNKNKAGEFFSYQIAYSIHNNPYAEQIILVWNPTQHRTNSITEITLEFPIFEENPLWQKPKITPIDYQDKPLNVKVISIDKVIRVFTHPKRLPIHVQVQQYKLLVEFQELAPLGYTAFIVNREDQLEPVISSIKEVSQQQAQMENKYLKINIHQDGTFDILNKTNNVKFENLHTLEDSGDEGHEYIFIPPQNNNVITNKNKISKIYCMQNDAFKQVYKISTSMDIPEGVDFINSCRKSFTIKHDIETILTLKTNSPYLEIKTKFVNQAMNHRLQTCFPLGIIDAKCFAESQFDIVERDYKNRTTKGDPNSGFVFVKNNEKGFALFCDGLPEYSYDAKKNCLSLTLLRAVGSLGQHHTRELKERIIDYLTYDSQCMGEIVCNYAIYVFDSDTPISEIKKHCDIFLNPPESFISHLTYKEFLKKSKREEISHNYFDPTYEQMFPYKRTLPSEMSLVKISNPNIVFSAFKKAERENEHYVFRVFNISEIPQDVTFEFFESIENIFEANLNEKPKKPINFNGNSVNLKIKPKKIFTMLIKFKV